MCPLYVAGLIGPGERKSIEPMAARLAADHYDRLHHFIWDGMWDGAPLEAELARQADQLVGGSDAFLVVDDTSMPKKGAHSVGVAPQYSYGLLTNDGYEHGAVKHGAKEWAYYDYRHDATHHTNNVESFWKLFKASVRGTHIHVSAKYMDRYLDEFSFRSNYRQMENAMFDLLIAAL